MSADLQPLWVLVSECKRLSDLLKGVCEVPLELRPNALPITLLGDWFATVAHELESQLRQSEVPAPAPWQASPDKIDGYNLALETLKASVLAFDELSQLGGRHMSRQAGSKAQVFARRCARAAIRLEKEGELQP